MPYSSSERQKQAQHESYLRNKKKVQSRARAIQERNKQYVLAYLREHPCVDCLEDDVVVLEFDHPNDDKLMAVCDLTKRTYSLAKIQVEIDKCEVVCANCHKRRTYSRMKSYRCRVD